MTPINQINPQPVTLRLPPDTEQKLREKARLAGVSLETYLEEVAAREADPTGRPDPLAQAVARLTGRTPAEVLADRERLLKTARRGRALPEGKTLSDVVEGTWPGDETDEQIREALDRLS